MPSYLFIDESGDPGEIASDGSNSTYYAELALGVNKDDFFGLLEHMINWRYIKGRFQEFKKLPGGKDLHRFLAPVIELHREGIVKCSGVYLDKGKYTGPYLKTTPDKESNPLRFRNFVHRQLLEFHFRNYPSSNNDIEVIFDRFEISKEAFINLEQYIQDNWNLPTFKYISHIDSVYCEALQLAGQLVNAIKDLKFGKANQELEELLMFLPIKDITDA